MNARYIAPFAPGQPYAIDPTIARELLSIALEHGGSYADLFFEYHVSGSYSYEEDLLKACGRSISLGLGVRVMSGSNTGYAYTQELTLERMKDAARTASAVARFGAGRSAAVPQLIASSHPERYGVQRESLACAGSDKVK